jgi:hypothetical protein
LPHALRSANGKKIAPSFANYLITGSKSYCFKIPLRYYINSYNETGVSNDRHQKTSGESRTTKKNGA